MKKLLIATHCTYLIIFVGIIFYFKENIIYAYMQNKIYKSRYSIELSEDVLLIDDKGKEIGMLFKGVNLVSPSIEDVDDTDLADNQRYKILLDVPNLLLGERKGDGYIVYSTAIKK